MFLLRFFIFVAFLYVPFFAVADERNEWFICDSDSDCTIIGGCQIRVVNKKFSDEANSYYQQQEASVSCPQIRMKDERYQIYCSHRKDACKKQTLFGEKIDNESTCVSAYKYCGMSVQKEIDKNDK